MNIYPRKKQNKTKKTQVRPKIVLKKKKGFFLTTYVVKFSQTDKTKVCILPPSLMNSPLGQEEYHLPHSGFLRPKLVNAKKHT